MLCYSATLWQHSLLGLVARHPQSQNLRLPGVKSSCASGLNNTNTAPVIQAPTPDH